ncbi:bacillithiol biosynthesis deacetylase BshB1 [Wenyingzhuangia marina]|uniref:Bacillithiol biosynthesis deacetylase BshB1 n=1 Tax=Wenyingzhuangia marina TaxID=1195760 RepID=A0A1M5U1F3_9FLAO|nr:bacillithiol biosynthesis deacetylase BshB1 [Wenyingzhuangia marina]GGF70067.1 bacillithiol biosynthesis deacetylase BshB1 [Wenyingzhuangia marina]SHH56788.1 bacillithiol biosynthesis deacetylase BshB1 [Wenyingzhuangia marina]
MSFKLDILAIGAHPDDVELGCGATIAKEVADGKLVGILDLTQGELGTRGTPKIRAMEAEAAAGILGVMVRENLGLPDGFLENTKEYQLKIVEIIRKYQPDVVLCNAIDDRHPDHAKASKLASDACFLSGLRAIKTDIGYGDQEAWRPKSVFHYIQWKNIEPDFVVDVSDYIDVKENAIKAFKSQFYDPNSNEPESPITSKNFIDSVLYRSRDLGRLTGVEFAEGFTTERYVTVKNLSDIF